MFAGHRAGVATGGNARGRAPCSTVHAGSRTGTDWQRRLRRSDGRVLRAAGVQAASACGGHGRHEACGAYLQAWLNVHVSELHEPSSLCKYSVLQNFSTLDNDTHCCTELDVPHPSLTAELHCAAFGAAVTTPALVLATVTVSRWSRFAGGLHVCSFRHSPLAAPYLCRV